MPGWQTIRRLAPFVAGMGALTGALEGLALATTLKLDLGVLEAMWLMLAALGAGMALTVGLALPAAVLVAPLWRRRPPWYRQSAVLGLVLAGIGAFYFWPLAMGLIQTGRVAGGVLGLTLPLAFLATGWLNGRYWLRRVELAGLPPSRFLLPAIGISFVISAGSALWLGLTTTTPSAVALEGDKNVLVVTIDTLRRDHVSAYGEPEAVPTPRFDGVAEEGVLFTDAMTPLPETTPAHASMFTGLHPVRHGVISNGHVLPAGIPTLAERLAAEGYTTGAFVSSFAVTRRTGLDQGFQIYDDDFFPWIHGVSDLRLVGLGLKVLMRFGDPLRFPFLLERGADETNARATMWMSRQGGPFFAWVHYFEPHAPYEIHGLEGDWPALNHRDILADDEGFDYTEEIKADLRILYQGEVIYVDRRLGDLLDHLARLNLEESTMVVVLSDHGEMLGEHGYHFNHLSLWEEVLRVPLAMRLPGLSLEGTVVDAQVRVMDVAPTVLAYLRLDPLKKVDGVDLLRYATGDADRSLASTLLGRKTGALDLGQLYGLRTGGTADGKASRIKYIRDADSGQEQLFDLGADPREQEDLAAEHPEIVERSRDYVTREISSIMETTTRTDQATEHALKALGYLD